MEMRNQKQDEKASKAMSEWWSECLLEDSTTPANVSAGQNNEGGGVLGDHQDLPFTNIWLLSRPTQLQACLEEGDVWNCVFSFCNNV